MKKKKIQNSSCLYCDVVFLTPARLICPSCGATYHDTCWEENRGCCNSHCKDKVDLGNYFVDFKDFHEKTYPNFQYGGLLRRAIAAVIDQMILLFLVMIASIFLGEMVLFFYLVTGWLYHASMESSKKQATIGKKMMKIIVADMSGTKISFWRSTKRYFSKLISILFFFMGYIMIIFTEEKQGLHDKLTNCLVIKRAEEGQR